MNQDPQPQAGGSAILGEITPQKSPSRRAVVLKSTNSKSIIEARPHGHSSHPYTLHLIDSISSTGFASFANFRGQSNPRQQSSLSANSHPNGSEQNAKSNEQKESFSNPQKLTESEKDQVEKLKQRDAEVRAHEQAHLAAAGSLAMGGPNYAYQTGPDGKQYAIGGDVKIDTSPGRTPEETKRKAQQIRAAALAPSDPSGQDLKVAAKASNMERSSEEEAKSSDEESRSDGSHPTGEITSSRQLIATDFSKS